MRGLEATGVTCHSAAPMSNKISMRRALLKEPHCDDMVTLSKVHPINANIVGN